MEELCVAVGCSSKSGKHKGLGFFPIPKIIINQGEEPEELAAKRRNKWISVVSCGDATNTRVLESERVVANTSSSESQHQIGINFMLIGFQLSPLERRNI